MAKNSGKYIWLLWMCGTTLFSYFYLSFTITIGLFLSGLIMVSKSLVEDFLKGSDETKNNRNHQNEKDH
jgi:hypothetical protein